MKRISSIVFALALALVLATAMVPIQSGQVGAASPTVVLVDNLKPSWTAPGGGGVYSAYYGPANGYIGVSPGITSLYDGREAAPIRAGINVDSDGHYWDQGLYAFKPNMTIDELAVSAITWDVESQYGACPVWMYIEIDKGGANDTVFQFVPTSNPAGWHTVDAAAGLWQKWNNWDGDTTGNPLITLSQLAGIYTGLDASRCYLNVGMGDAYHDNPNGTVDWVDKVTIGTVTYDFVLTAPSTVFVDNLQPNWTAPGGGGVFSAYIGPPGYGYVSPGTTAAYDGREAAPIMAGINVDPDDGHYWDQCLYAFKPDMTIDELAVSVISWDVEAQYGACPVWMYMQIDRGGPNETMFQFVPTSNPAGWHTVDAAAGLWQKWNNMDGDTTGNPLITLSQVAGIYTGLTVSRCYLNVGMGDAYHDNPDGTVDWVDKITIGSVTYDFVVPSYWYVAKTGSDTNEGTLVSPFLTIQHAVDSAASGDTVHVAAGTYVEQVVINKNLTLLGTGDPVIQAPASPTKFKFPESAAWWDPVVFAFGGTNVGGTISGAGTVAVNVAGFTVDGNDRVPYDRAAGILFRNAAGNISDNTVQNMYIDGKQTLGILVYGDSDVAITGNDVSGYARGGIVANGDSITSPSYPTPHAVIEGNTVTGPGMGVPVTWAPNGIQIGYKATGKIIGNDVSANGWPGTEWTGSGIIVAGADNVEIYDNNVHGGQTGIAVCGYMWSPTGATAQGTWIHHNTVDSNTYGISIQDKSVNTTIEYNVVHNSSYDGIDICNFYGYAPTGTVIERNSIIENNSEDDPGSGGVWIDAGIDGNEVAVHFNNIVDNNQYGINNTSTDNSVNATYNWWGSNSGPYHPTKNPSGTGDGVSDYVDFEPWLLVELPTATTQAATTITNTAATLNMNFAVGGYASVDVRLAYKKSSDPTWSYTSWVSKSASGTHAASVAGLSSNTQYDFKAQLKYVDVEFGDTTLDGATLQFTTLRTPGTVTTQAATGLSYFTAILNMGYTVGDFSPVQVRFAYKKASATEWHYTAWVSKSTDGSHSEPRGLLQLGTTYQFKAQLEYDSTLIEGATLQFTTSVPPPWGAGGCFIATAAYGTSTAPQLDLLREFRDVVLLKSTVGSQFVSLYYRLSPPIANFIAGHEAVRTLVRELLIDPIVWLVDTTGGLWGS